MAERGVGTDAVGSAPEKVGTPPAVDKAASKEEPTTDAKEPAVSAAGSGTMVVSARLASELQRHSGVAGANPSATATLATGIGEDGMVTAPAAHEAGGGAGEEREGRMAPPIAPSPAQQPVSEAEPAASGARTEGTAKEAVLEDGAEEESLEGLDEFIQELKEQANVDSEKTVVINAPRSLVREENEFMLEARSRYIERVLAHKSIGVTYKSVRAEHVVLMPARDVGQRARDGGDRVEIGFLHIVFRTVGLAQHVLSRFDAACPLSTGGLEMEWGGGKHQARLAPAGKVAWVMSPDSPEWRDLELTTNPVWRVAVANTGITPSTENVQRMERWGGYAVKRLNGKLREWKVDGRLEHVATRPVFTKDSPVAKGMVMTVEVVKEPWAVPKGLVLAAGQPEARLLWLVVGVRRHEWSGDAPVKGKGQGPARTPGTGWTSNGPGWSGKGSFGFGKGKGDPSLGKGKGGKGVAKGKGDKGGKESSVDKLRVEVEAWTQCVASFTGEAARRRDTLLQWWGPECTCAMALYFTVKNNKLAGCRSGQCKATAVANAPLLRPCGVEPGRDREYLVPDVLKREEKAPYGTAAALFGGGQFEMPATPSASKKTPRRGANHGGEASKAARTVDRWATGGKASASAGVAGPSVFNRLGPRRDEGSGEVAAAGWTLQKAAAEGGKAVEPERLSARDERVSRMGQERDDVMEEEDEGRRGPMEAADSAVDRGAAEATADKGRQESKPTKYRIPRKGREQGEEAALPAGGRKRRVEDEETSETCGKSPRGDEEEELLGFDEERDGIGDVVASDDEDMLGQD